MLPKTDLTSDEVLSKLDWASRKARIISIILTAIAILILAILIYFISQSIEEYSRLQTKIAEAEKKLRETETKLDDSNIKIEKAENSTEGKPECTETRNILAAENTDISVNPTPVISNTPLKTPSVNPTPNKVATPDNSSPSSVYVHIVDESQRSPAQQLINNSQNGKFKFEGIENIKVKISQTQIRFFTEADEPRARDLARLLQSRGITARILKINYNSDKLNLPLEIWFSNDAFAK